MESISLLTETGETIDFVGELIAEGEEEHQIEARTPINTETVRLYKRDDGKYMLVIQFQFEGMDPHLFESHIGDSPAEILSSLTYPTEESKRLLQGVN